MIDREHDLPPARQAKALGISRGSVYYLPRPVSDADLALMRRIDELHLDYPFAGSRMLQGLLLGEDYRIGRLHVRTLMKRMGIEAIYRRPNTSKPAPGHKIYPYLPRQLAVTRPNQSRPVNGKQPCHARLIYFKVRASIVLELGDLSSPATYNASRTEP